MQLLTFLSQSFSKMGSQPCVRDGFDGSESQKLAHKVGKVNMEI